MADTTLGPAGNTPIVTLQDLSDAFIIENSARKEAILTPMPLYTKDSNETDVFDFGGVIKTITLIGFYAKDTQADAKAFIDSVEAFVQGQQDTDAGYPIDFKDDLRGNLKVKIMNFDSTQMAGDVTQITWNLKLVQSSLKS